MIPFVAMSVILALSFSLFLFNTFSGFREFFNHSQSLNLWDTMTLAATNRVTRETNNFLIALRESLLDSIQSYNTSNAQVDTNLNAERASIVRDYLSKLELGSRNNELTNTIEFGLHPYDNSAASDYSKTYEATLVHSDYLPTKTNDTDKSYASSLITDQQILTKLDIHELESKILDGDKLIIDSALLSELLDLDSFKLIEANQALFNIELRNDGLGFNNLPNGIEVDITTSSQT